MAKIIYIIPGFKHDVLSADYVAIAEVFAQQEFEVVPVPVTWERKVLSDWVKEVSRHFDHGIDDEVYMFGFSYGAMIALIAASNQKFAGLFLASLSPYFEEDFVDMPERWRKVIGMRRVDDFSTYTFAEIAKRVACSTWLFIGEDEAAQFPQLKQRVNEAAGLIDTSSLHVVPKTGHDIGAVAYRDSIAEVVDKFLSV